MSTALLLFLAYWQGKTTMTTPQILIFAILTATMALFLWGRFRHDIVALLALLACTLTGLVPAENAFSPEGELKRVDTIARVRRAFHIQGWSMKKIARDLPERAA